MLDALSRRGVPAADAAAVVQEEVAAVRAGAPTDNFGAFVQGRLEAGLRGRALADAIRAEHERRGRGMGRSEGNQSPARARRGSATPRREWRRRRARRSRESRAGAAERQRIRSRAEAFKRRSLVGYGDGYRRPRIDS
jgi:hypothetical protein